MPTSHTTPTCSPVSYPQVSAGPAGVPVVHGSRGVERVTVVRWKVGVRVREYQCIVDGSREDVSVSVLTQASDPSALSEGVRRET